MTRRKLTDDQVVAIRKDQRPGIAIADQYGITRAYVYQLKSGICRKNAISSDSKEVEPNICGLSDEAILEIVYSNDSIWKLAMRYGISQGSVRRILMMFGKELPTVKRKRLTGKEIEEIYAAARPQSVLAREYGVTQSYVSQVKNGKNAYVRKHRKRLEAKNSSIPAPKAKRQIPNYMAKLMSLKSRNAWTAAIFSTASFAFGSGVTIGLLYVAGLII